MQFMRKRTHHVGALVAKARRPWPEKVAEVDGVVERVARRNERRLTRAAATLSAKAFSKVWNNPRDGAYDRLEGALR
jgi:hypothetical protein